MSRRAVLDACVLVPYNLASLLLTCAERGLFEPRWSETILEETHRALTTKIGLEEQRAARRLDAMQHAFPEAEVVGFDAHLEGLQCHPKDRHVLAAAIASDADVIVTFNLDDFPDAACEPHGVLAIHPEHYLLELLATDPEATLAAVVADAARRTSPPARASELLAWLAATVPTFANLAHAVLLDDGPYTDIPAYVIADPCRLAPRRSGRGRGSHRPAQAAGSRRVTHKRPDSPPSVVSHGILRGTRAALASARVPQGILYRQGSAMLARDVYDSVRYLYDDVEFSGR